MTLPAQIPLKQAGATPAHVSENLFGSLQREIDRLFDDFTPRFFNGFNGGRVAEVGCKMDLADTDEGLELTIEAPGLDAKDIEVSVADGLLIVAGEKKLEGDKAGRNYRFVERRYGGFSRAMALPDGAKVDQIKATLDKGVLKVTVPTPAPAKPMKIAVQTVR
jgi:HSP20 family protein